MAGGFGEIGTAHFDVALDFDRAIREIREAKTRVPPLEVRVDLDQSQTNREVAATLETAETAAGPIEPLVIPDQTQATAALRRTLATASAAAGPIPVRLNQQHLNAIGNQIRSTLAGAFGAVAATARTAFLPAAIGAVVAGDQLRRGAEDAKEFSESLTSVRSALRRAGRQSGLTAGMIRKLAARFEGATSIQEESIQASEALLVRLGVVSRENIEPMTQLFLDTAAGMRKVSDEGVIAESFAKKFARIIGDPVRGLSLLGREGINVSAALKENVKDLVETGRKGEATSLVADLLREKYAGAAAELGTSIPGQLRLAQDAFADARRDLAKPVLVGIAPILRELGENIAKTINENRRDISKFIVELVRGGAKIVNFITTNEEFHEALRVIGSNAVAAFKAIRDFVGAVVAATREGGNLAPIMTALRDAFDSIRAGLSGFAEGFRTAFQSAAGSSSENAETISELLRGIGRALGILLTAAGFALGGIAAFFVNLVFVIRESFAAMNRAFNSFKELLRALARTAQIVLASIAGFFRQLGAAISQWWAGVRANIDAAVERLRAFRDRLKAILTIDLLQVGKNVMGSFLEGLRDGFEPVKEFVNGIAKWIEAHKGPISLDRQLLVPAGNAIMSGFFEGLRNRWANVQDWVSNIGGFFKGAIAGQSLDMQISNILLGSGSISSLNNQVASLLNIPANLVAGGIMGLHPTSGWADTLSQVRILERAFSVGMTSGLRSVDTVPGPGVSQHVLGQAADFGTSRGSINALTSLATYTSRLVGSVFKQVIWLNKLWAGGFATPSFVADHMDHVHLGWKPRAAGGGARKGDIYSWNERGTELFTPNGNGYVWNTTRTKELIAALKGIGKGSTDNRQQQLVINAPQADARTILAIGSANLGAVFSRA